MASNSIIGRSLVLKAYLALPFLFSFRCRAFDRLFLFFIFSLGSFTQKIR